MGGDVRMIKRLGASGVAMDGEGLATKHIIIDFDKSALDAPSHLFKRVCPSIHP